MPGIPSRQGLAHLTETASTIAPLAILGFARSLDHGRTSVFFSYPQGIGEYVLAASETLDALRPDHDGLRQMDAAAFTSTTAGAVEWLLTLTGVKRLVSVPVAQCDQPTRFWVGLKDPDEPSADQRRRFEALAATSASLLNAPVPPAETTERLERLELAADLLPALLRSLDVREVFDRVSAAAKRALPHDLLLLDLFSEDLSKIIVFARSDGAYEPGTVVPHAYPAPVVRAWTFHIIHDLSSHPVEAENTPTRLGARSALFLPIRFDDRVMGGIGFLSHAPACYAGADVAIGRRLADHVAVGLSHYRLAEERSRAAELQARAANLEVLDGLLATLTGVLDIREVFDRVSTIAATVLPHDAVSIAEVIDDGVNVRIHASHGLGKLPEPYDIPAPDPTMVTDHWDFRLIDDVLEHPEYSRGPGWAAGMRSMMFVPIRLEGKLFGGLNFYSRTVGRFVRDDVIVGRRITDHVALAISHSRLAEQARRNEELRAQAQKLDLLDEVLASVTNTGELREVFNRVSQVTRKVLAHDALVLAIRLPDGQHARIYASSMPDGRRFPDVVEIPPFILANPQAEFEIVGDLQTDPRQRNLAATQLGFRGALRVLIRIDNEFAAGMSFLSLTPGQYRSADMPVASRIADRVALSLARERNAMLLKQADDAAARASRLEARVRELTDELDARTGYRRVVGESREWRQVLTQATQVASTEATVLLLGESGTGKEVVARFLHRASARSAGPYVAINCAALPEQLLEAELFGYERGAYTGATQSKPGQLEQAAGGTLFLDEVAEMSPSAQAKFLRVLQEREFQRLGGTRVLRTDVRIVAATNRDLQRAIGQGLFREDLYYRLNVFAIRLPPLRDRRNDILPLSEAFLGEIGRGLGRPPGGISRDARQLLIDYPWPGNVRELRNILERAAILCDGGLITAEHLALTVVPAAAITARDPAPAAAPVASAGGVPAAPSSAGDLQAMERTMIEQALQAARFNKSKAAKALGLTRHQLYIRMRKYGFE